MSCICSAEMIFIFFFYPLCLILFYLNNGYNGFTQCLANLERIRTPCPRHFPVPMVPCEEHALLTYLSMEIELGAVRLSPRLCAARSKVGKAISTGDLSESRLGQVSKLWDIMRNRLWKPFEIRIIMTILLTIRIVLVWSLP